MDLQSLVEHLHLKPHPEGGYYRETYRAEEKLELGPPYQGPRSAGTAIYFLLSKDNFSAFHRVRSDEIFHFYLGDAVELYCLDDQGALSKTIVGPDILSGETVQHLVPAGTWQALRVRKGGRFALLGTTVSPGFEFEDFELGDRSQLVERYPQHKQLIFSLT